MFILSYFSPAPSFNKGQPPKAQKKEWRASVFLGACAPLQTSARVRKRTPPPMHRSRRLGWACRDAPKEAKLHGRQCPSDASLRVKFPRLYSDASQTRVGLHSPSPSPRGKSGAPNVCDDEASSLRTRNATNYSKTAALESSAYPPAKGSPKGRLRGVRASKLQHAIR